jgi:hypothetical protein
MMCVFARVSIDGKEKAANRFGMVEGKCEESAGVGEGEVVATAGSEEARTDAGRGGAEGDEVGDKISVD